MGTFKLNKINPVKSFCCLRANSEFLLGEVIFDYSLYNISTDELKKHLLAFYIEVEEVYDKDDRVVKSRSRPFELSKQIYSSNNSIHFNRSILNEELDINGMRQIYNKLIIKLISRYSANYDFLLR